MVRSSSILRWQHTEHLLELGGEIAGSRETDADGNFVDGEGRIVGEQLGGTL